ncbi:P-loop containing nucleoside triphosphate hydrolase protein [Leucosporidium creatinivorum]|uniref:p-loop containing nucleoside triphosphate hydrolase protein n=1 Tax=Leucosporidium creatinivorum TaxID=106004 RepID=A0A1Y2ELM0_9BASI|nr:P-loop containing nucleoside triphosphate hydrolase protein [Leucosporidium creatinivorum]
MEQATAALVEHILSRYASAPPDTRILIGIAGVPGSGKSTLAYPLVDQLNERLGVNVKDPAHLDREEAIASPGVEEPGKQIAVAVGLDGWHCTRAELDAFSDPSEARRRRGAAFTFDSTAYVSFVQSLRASPPLPSIPFRTFSHALKDPQPGPYPIEPHHRIIIIEGLYCLLDVEPWREATELLDERVWVECERSVARERLVRRHLKEGVEYEQDKAEARVDKSDMLNGEYIREHLTEPTITFSSIEDPSYAIA